MIEPEEALAHGLINAVFEPDRLLPEALALCQTLAAKSPVALAYAKEALNLALQGDHAANLETEARLFAMLFASEDQKEGMAAFVEKREPRFSGR
jgi:enoyl-CoA hydratase/carnithine racemase